MQDTQPVILRGVVPEKFTQMLALSFRLCFELGLVPFNNTAEPAREGR